jgi:archaellum component FlaC
LIHETVSGSLPAGAKQDSGTVLQEEYTIKKKQQKGINKKDAATSAAITKLAELSEKREELSEQEVMLINCSILLDEKQRARTSLSNINAEIDDNRAKHRELKNELQKVNHNQERDTQDSRVDDLDADIEQLDARFEELKSTSDQIKVELEDIDTQVKTVPSTNSKRSVTPI